MQVNHDEVLRTARQMVENNEVQPPDDLHLRRAFNPAAILAALDKYGPGIVASLAPLAGGVNAATLASVVLNIVQAFNAQPPAPAPAS